MQPALDDRLAALQTMSAAQLRAEWMRVYKAPAPPLTADLLARGIAWRLQEKVHGGLPPATLRELRRLKRQLDKGDTATNVYAGRIKPGTRLVRDWGGESHHVVVRDQGYTYRDQHYASLSHIARVITGAHWSGPRFFALNRKRVTADA